MKYVAIIPKGPEVSRLCLGTGSFGSTLSKEDAFKQMDLFFNKGGNFFDTARVYADWLPGGHGASESAVGSWIELRKNRNKIVISTKGAHPALKSMNISRMSPGELRSDLEESLRCLKTDYIDLYFLHRDDNSRSVEEILQSLEVFKKEGKILHYGFSNWTLNRMKEADMTASHLGFEGFICDQIRFSLADLNCEAVSDKTCVSMDRDVFNWHEKTGKVVMAYTSSAKGWFSKKLQGKPVSAGAEAEFDIESNWKLLEKLRIWEKELNLNAQAIVSAYVMSQSFPAVPISSFSSTDQLKELLLAGDFTLPLEIRNEIQAVKIFTRSLPSN
jgi:aryl-alcohol dehydrogenase-like predicted oxidoreductase